jgi:hypothetical protein
MTGAASLGLDAAMAGGFGRLTGAGEGTGAGVAASAMMGFFVIEAQPGRRAPRAIHVKTDENFEEIRKRIGPRLCHGRRKMTSGSATLILPPASGKIGSGHGSGHSGGI